MGTRPEGPIGLGFGLIAGIGTAVLILGLCGAACTSCDPGERPLVMLLGVGAAAVIGWATYAYASQEKKE